MPTIAEIATELGVCKATVNNWIKEFALENHVSTKGDGRRTKIVDAYAASVLASKAGVKEKTTDDGLVSSDGHGTNALIDALNAHIADLQKVAESRSVEMERREEEHRRALDEKSAEIEELKRKLERSIEAERRATEILQRVAGAGLWQRVAGFKGLIGNGS